MADVAAVAGVSYQTVSRVLNEPERVRESTRERVRAAIAELGYTRNLAARALKTTRTGIIAVVTDGSPLFGPAATTAAIEWAARDAGCSTLLAALRPGSAPTAHIARELLERGAEGIIVVAPHDDMIPALTAIARDTPVVSVSGLSVPVAGIRTVAVDQEAGARSVVAHLAARGHLRILHLPGPGTWFDARSRVSGFREAVEELGLDGEVAAPLDWSARAGYERGRELARRPLPDAVFAANDQIALGLLRALREQGIGVPQDVSVVGFDDIEGSDCFPPPLTTVRQPFADLGWAAVHVLTAGDDDAPRPHTRLPPTLVERDSVADL